jgi:drug/metabolite transporter (DMT)-like permease
MLLCAIIFAGMSGVVKFLTASISPDEIIMARFLVGAVVLAAVSQLNVFNLQGRSLPLLLARAITGSVSGIAYFKAIGAIPLPNASVLLYTYPIFASIFAAILLKEKLRNDEKIAILLGFLGVYLIVNPNYQSISLGEIYALIASVLAGLAMVFLRKLRANHDSNVIYFYFCLVGIPLALPETLRTFITPNIHQTILISIIAVASLIAQLLMTYAFKFCKAGQGSAIMMTQVLYTSLIGKFFFQDTLTQTFILGGFLVLGCGLYLVFPFNLNFLKRILFKGFNKKS